MESREANHDTSAKTLLNGVVLPAGQTTAQDLEGVVDCLFRHPNAGPFLARRLIQRLTTSNPSPKYVGRVAAIFANNGAGVRGDLKAVVRAILLDPEARTYAVAGQIKNGMLRESFLRRVHLARAFDARSFSGSFPIADQGAPVAFGQRPMSSPTVFNFFLPDHQPTGPIADAGLYAPEFQIITAVTAITSANALRSQVVGTMNQDDNEAFEVRLDLSDEIAIADDVRALIDRLDLLLMYGNMSQPMRAILVRALEQRSDPEERAQMAIQLIAIAPEYAVLK